MNKELVKTVIDEAANQVLNVKGSQHGDVEDSFGTIASFWSVWLSARNRIQVDVSPYDVAEMMTLLKKGRKIHGNTTVRDHFVDDVGYVAIAASLAEREMGTADFIDMFNGPEKPADADTMKAPYPEADEAYRNSAAHMDAIDKGIKDLIRQRAELEQTEKYNRAAKDQSRETESLALAEKRRIEATQRKAPPPPSNDVAYTPPPAFALADIVGISDRAGLLSGE